MNPYAREPWGEALRAAIMTHGLRDGPLFMPTAPHRPWHFGPDYSTDLRGRLDLPGIVEQAEEALDGLSYAAMVEIAPPTYFGRRYIAPHVQGFLSEDLPRGRREILAVRFEGGPDSHRTDFRYDDGRVTSGWYCGASRRSNMP